QGAMLSPPTTYKAEALGFRRIWSGLGVEYPSLVYAVRKPFLRDSEAVALRSLQAMAEGVHIFNTNKEEALKVMAKYTKVTDRKVLENSYADNSGVHSPTLEPTRSAIANILETLAGTAPKAATAKPHRAGLDKRPAKLRELKREPAFDQPFTSAGGDETKTHETKGVRIISGLSQSNDLLVAVADMDRNSHVQTFRFP